MREKEVEKYLIQEVEKLGGLCKKWVSPGSSGEPDRIVILPWNRIYFVELKAPCKQMRLLQRKRRQQLEALGFPVFCVDCPEQIQPAIDALIHWSPGEPIPQGIGAKIPEKDVATRTLENHRYQLFLIVKMIENVGDEMGIVQQGCFAVVYVRNNRNIA